MKQPHEKRLERWENVGMLEGLDENKKQFLANVYELLMKQIMYSDLYNEQYNTVIFPIVRRISEQIEFGVNDFFFILDKVREHIVELNEMDTEDNELIFCVKYSEIIINELKTKTND
jgi:hypothetical protein